MTEDSFGEQLRACLQAESDPKKLERLAAELLGNLLGVTLAIAGAGFQHGADAGTSGRQGRQLRVECKKYGDSTELNERELLGEIDQALQRDPSLEAWILVSTRDVREQIEQSLNRKAEEQGIPILVIDWKRGNSAALAALCVSAPEIVRSLISHEAGELAQRLQVPLRDGAERLRRELVAWQLGFGALRARSLSRLEEIWRTPRVSKAVLGQDAAGGATEKRIRRRQIHELLDTWWANRGIEDAPAAVVGLDGVGKTWAVLDWLVDRSETLPIVLLIPSSAVPAQVDWSEGALKEYLAGRIYELAGVRSREHWLRRLDRLLQRPIEEGPVLLVVFDGLNQEPSVSWVRLLEVLQGRAFEGRVRVMLTTRPSHYKEKLRSLQSLTTPPVKLVVESYCASPGGELDQILAREGMTRADFHPEVIELLRTPRVFSLISKLRTHLGDCRHITIHGLLWEYARTSFGERGGRSFSEREWRAWLQEIASRLREGVRALSPRVLDQTVTRGDLTASDVYARLSDIVDGHWTELDLSGNAKLRPEVVAHALGAALLVELDALAGSSLAEMQAALTRWLDPVAGFEEPVEVLRAAVSILVARGGPTDGAVAGALVTAWLQAQNIPESHRIELFGLAEAVPLALLDAVEQSREYAQSSARECAVWALRGIDRSNEAAMRAIVAKATAWLGVVSREVRARELSNLEYQKSRGDRFVQRVGVDASGQRTILGTAIELVDWDEGDLGRVVPSLLEGFPLAEARSVMEVAAVSLAVGGKSSCWDGMRWLCRLNTLDPQETSSTLRTLAAQIRCRSPEAGVHPALGDQVAANLLWLSGEEADEEMAAAISPTFGHVFNYERDYLVQPSKGFPFALERRHAIETLLETDVPLLARIQRTRDFWVDPGFQPPSAFVEEVRTAAASIDVEKLDRHVGNTIEDHNYETFEPAIARCAPDILAKLTRRRMLAYRSLPPELSHWAAVRSTDHLLLASDAERAAARELRVKLESDSERPETFAANQLLIVELSGQPGAKQAEITINANLAKVYCDLELIVNAVTPVEAEALVARYGMGSSRQQRDVLIMLGRGRIALSEVVWEWVLETAFSPDLELHFLAFRVLSHLDAKRFGGELLKRDWRWAATSNPWVGDYGSSALIDATGHLPFEQVALRLAPWRLIEAARTRGCVVTDIQLAARIVGAVLDRNGLEESVLVSNLSVERARGASGPCWVSVEAPVVLADLTTSTGSLSTGDTDALEKAHDKAAVVASQRIREAWESGARLHLVGIATEDMETVLRYAPEFVDAWLDGAAELAPEFRGRVQLAEPTYLALCEALLMRCDSRGATLWRALRETMMTRVYGEARVEELIHMAFRLPDSPVAEELRGELIELENCHTDRALLDIAIAATINKRDHWLSRVIATDKASLQPWRQRRGIVLEGLRSGAQLPVDGTWPEGEIRTRWEELRVWRAKLQHREACARHWWNEYWSNDDLAQSYAAWRLFLQSADRRVWAWANGPPEIRGSAETHRLKHVNHRLSRGKVKNSVDQAEKDWDRRFLNREIVKGIGPW